MVLTETVATPMHIGALIVLQIPAREKASFADRIVQQITDRLPATPLMCVLRQAPVGYDFDVWQDLAKLDIAAHLHRVEAVVEMDDQAIRDFVAWRVMERLDLSRPPFQIDILDRLKGDRSALFIRMHHAVADGIGFQSVLDLLSDATAPAPPRTSAAVLPTDDVWREHATARFEAEAALRE